MNQARIKAQAECEPDEMPLIVFIGDGVSDLAAAREADVLFARRGLRLEEYCIEHGIAYTPFDSFADVKKEVEAISIEDQKKTGGVGKPVRYNPRANMWRRISSKEAVCHVSWIVGDFPLILLFQTGSYACRYCYAFSGGEDGALAGLFLRA